jgi:hypothetical protein
MDRFPRILQMCPRRNSTRMMLFQNQCFRDASTMMSYSAEKIVE